MDATGFHVDELRRRLLAAAAIKESSRGIAIGAEFEQERDHVGVARRRRDVQRRFLVMVRVIGEEEDDRDQREDEGEQHETLHEVVHRFVRVHIGLHFQQFPHAVLVLRADRSRGSRRTARTPSHPLPAQHARRRPAARAAP